MSNVKLLVGTVKGDLKNRICLRETLINSLEADLR